ncbi:MAG: ABC transporter permease [Gammaproteobacteria bacterium]|nr:ABC transporter permease [Gammaproteobacteria bacterium]MCF6260512.1 ABC transporter permease [Gammaproteobacteria bacterium]
MMKRSLANIFQLGIKELFSLRYDPVMLFLIVYMFSFSVMEEAQNATTGVVNAAVAIVDEDHSRLSRRIGDALLQPQFQPPVALAIDEIDASMEAARYAFVIDIPPRFQADLMAGRPTVIQLNVDATAMGLAGTGAGYIQHIISQELSAFLNNDQATDQKTAVNIVTRAKFNPNLEATGFQGAMALTNNITMMAILLTGAALIREREHGTIEHLLVMPLRPFEIMLAKVWSNGLVVVIAATLSLYLVIKGVLGTVIIGSIPLYLFVTVIYLFSVTSLGIYLATLARSMPQFGLLAMIVFVMMLLLSGAHTPLESMPVALQMIMQLLPSTHFVSMAQAVLFRGAGLSVK